MATVRDPDVQRTFAERLKALPTTPGVYLMKDDTGAIIYVGKAASLRSRVRSYFQAPSGKEFKTQVLVTRIADFEFIKTESVTEALLLENLLIKQHKPFFNIRLKDDKTYPYIKVDLNEEFPQVYFTRRVLPDGARYFGPFASASSVRKTMDLLKRLFPYRSCTKVITGNDPRPCLEYFIHRCAAPCTGAASKEEYHEVMREVVMFLEGESDAIVKEVEAKMQRAAEELRFERAALLRDQLRAIESVSESQKVVSGKGEDQDVIAVAADEGQMWVEQFKVRNGKLIGRDHFLMEGGAAVEPPVVLENFIQQFYENAPEVPPTLLVQHPLENAAVLADWLSRKRGGRVSIHTPRRGDKRKLMAMVVENATEGVNQRRIKWLTEGDKVVQAMAELQEALNLPELPERIECYDISNIQGTNSVGSMVVFEGGRPKTAHYRRFKIKTVEGIDDYSSMREMLRRRFKRLAETRREGVANENQRAPVPPHAGATSYSDAPAQPARRRKRRYAKTGALAPDEAATGEALPTQSTWELVPSLVIIDGGKGHLAAAHEVFMELGLTDVPLVSLAKAREELFLPHSPDPVLLPRTSQALYLVQRVRDEAHRFAITYHRLRRSKAATRSLLDAVQGIGPRRRRELMRRFGGVGGIRDATLDEVAAVPGMTMALAKRLAAHLGGKVAEGIDATRPAGPEQQPPAVAE
ncbi:MAG: excinuclease ABC subunit UvrC [SAR202 cluster bacterium]|nr:excinuclease ABC subunit UvrC [SAR202 cluster bacterium]